MGKIVHSLIILSGALGGCSLFTRPMEKPVIEDSIRKGYFKGAEIGILSLTPERRIVLHNFKTGRFCAENPTEVGVDMASASKLLASADLPDKTKGELGLALAAASNNSVLNRRTQGMQLFMASSYSICQLYLNGGISPEEFIERQTHIFNESAKLIEVELRIPIKEVTSTKPVAPAASAAESMLNQVDRTVTRNQPAPPASPPSN